jgi:hypothetical protein
MTLQQQLQQELSALPPFSSGEQHLELREPGQELRCELVALDSLACAFKRITLRADNLVGATVEQLKPVAERLSARLTYLLEPISPIEIDSQGCVVQMRSTPPQKDNDRTSYYELLVSRSGELSLCRYTRPVGQQREMIGAHVTREVLGRLAADFSAVVQ